MRDYLELGSTPALEECVQVGTGSPNEMIRECYVYMRQLKRMFPDASFGVKSFEHDLGTYREVVVYYDSLDCESLDCESLDCESQETALSVEHNLPGHWDRIAIYELMPRITSDELAKDLAEGPYTRSR